MKKLILIMLFTVAMFAVKAQTATINLAGTNTSAAYNVSKTLTDNVVQYFAWNAPQSSPVSVDYSATITKVTGTHSNVYVALWGKCFTGDVWVLIASLNTGEISTPYIVQLSSAASNQYRYFKTEYTGTGTATSTITAQNFKVWLR